jgi:hypothetical protein
VAKWPHSAWKGQALSFDQGSALLPFYATRAIPLGQVTANSTSSITVVRSRYDVVFQASLVLGPTGTAPAGNMWWHDVQPVFALTAGDSRSPFEVSYWAIDPLPFSVIASEGWDLSVRPGVADATTGWPTEVATWHAHGETEGMRVVAAGLGASVLASVSINYNSYLAGYPSGAPDVEWHAEGYLKTYFGSATTVT